MRRWRVETVSGGPQELERKLNEVERRNGSLAGITAFSGAYPSWTVVWTEYAPDEPAKEAV